VIVPAFRLASWRRPLRTEPSRVAGRFHRAAEPSPTQYACLHPLGPWAELIRSAELRTAAELTLVSHRTWALRVELEELPRIGFAQAQAHGLRPGDLVSDDLRACQRLANRLRAGGAPGAIVPSAALPGTDNLVLFGARAAAPYRLDPRSAVDVPAAVTADRAGPPLGLLPRVRLHGMPHAALEAWRAGDDYRFVEPAP
jgi:RES domain